MELDLKVIIGSYAQITIFLLMLNMSLTEGFQSLSFLWRRPPLLLRCLIASFVLVPLVGIAILSIFSLPTSARIALMAMAICPGAPLTYTKLTKMKASTSLAGSYQVIISLFAVLLVPTWILILASIYPNQATVTALDVFKQVTTVQLIPIIVGLGFRKWLPEFADDLMDLVGKVSAFMFLGVVIILLIVALPLILKLGISTWFSIILFITLGIAIGHFLGGPEPETRLTIGLANSTRNAGLALALVTLNFQERILPVSDSGNGDPGILAVIAAIALLAFVMGAIYANVYRKQLAQAAQPNDISS